jgi:ArsR family transcriptional regulator
MKDTIKIFKALSDPTRVRILLLLRRRDLCVCELVYVLGMEQSRVSHHMRVLREAELAEDVREGRWIIYRIPGTARGLVDGLFGEALRERTEGTSEAIGDLRRLEDCVRENVRGLVCGGPQQSEE